jgi:hypothetical protein
MFYRPPIDKPARPAAEWRAALWPYLRPANMSARAGDSPPTAAGDMPGYASPSLFPGGA